MAAADEPTDYETVIYKKKLKSASFFLPKLSEYSCIQGSWRILTSLKGPYFRYSRTKGEGKEYFEHLLCVRCSYLILPSLCGGNYKLHVTDKNTDSEVR